MDKRSLLFVLVLMAALFFVNSWFSDKDTKPRPASTPKYKTEEVEKEERDKLSKRVAPLSSLPMISLFSDAEGKKLETLSVQVSDQYLTFSTESDAPKTLYAKRGKTFEKVDLRSGSQKSHSPVLYSSSNTKPLQIVRLPANEPFDVQLVSFTDNNEKASVTLGIAQNQQIYVPLEKPSSPAIALYKSQGTWLPYAVYDPSSYKLSLLDEYPSFSSIVQVKEAEIALPVQEDGEEFYVLENGYQQLVFSNIGGALSEINLPFKDSAHPNRAIREIEFDRTLKKDYPQTDYFPNSSYKIADPQGGDKPITVLKRSLGGYYPLIRRNLVAPGGRIASRIPHHDYALTLTSHDEKTDKVVYKLKKLDKDSIEFEASQAERKITKKYSLPKNPDEAPYCFDVSIKVEGDARDLWLTTGIPEVELMSGSFTPALKYRVSGPKKSTVEQIDIPKSSLSFASIRPDWICNSNGFLGVILDPLTDIDSGFSAHRIPGEFDPTRLTVIDAQYDRYPAEKYPGYEMKLPLRNTSQTQVFRVFAGPFASEILKTVDKTYSDSSTGYNPNYISSQSFHGWFSFISEPFSKFLFFLMKVFYQISRSWGISIILLTIALRIMLYPLNAWSIKSTAKMQEISPQVSALQEKYKKDPKRAQVEVMNLYREKGVNPFSGCLPILIQLPFLIGMFDLLKSTFELRGAPFIPHWIDNLTAPDILFSWNYPIIFFGTDFHLLPILIGLVMFWQQKFSSTTPKDKKLMTDQQKQQKFMGNIMVIVFTVMFYNFPSGLNIYWLFSILLGILQQWFMTRQNKKINPHIEKI
jgi:YidC/Oxa1 family membrane protein insertase